MPVRRQAWLAAALLLCPWLATLCLYQPLGAAPPIIFATLLPGLLVAVHLQRQLFTHLASNHPRGKADQPYSTLGAANWITLLRATGIVALAGFLPQAAHDHVLPPALLWAPGLIYLGISLADLLDGIVARKQHRETELGQHLDIETDAAGLLVAVLLAVSLQRLPPLSLLVGLAYYFFIAGIWWRQKRHLPLIALQSRPYSRIIAGLQMGVVAAALLPLFHPACISLAAYLVMTPLLLGFVRDWLVVSCRMHTDSHQQTVLDHWAGRAWTRALPLALRLILLASGIAMLAQGDVASANPLWKLLLSGCGLLAGVGFLGRSGAMAMALLLSCNLSPFGISAPLLVLFSAATALMLTGTGPFSLWSPEEAILYRRRPDESAEAGERP